MSNKGIDLQMNYRGKVNKDFSYNLGVTFSRYKNEVLTLDANSNAFVRSGGSRIGDLTYTTDSLAIGQFYGYIQDGIWESQDEINRVLFENPGDAKPGRFKFRDINGDGQITALDETTIGSPHPDFTYGLNFSANYRSFDFTIYGQGVYGNDLFNYVKYFSHTPAFQANYSREMLYEAGKTLPVLDNNDNYSNQRSSFYVEDGSYFRLKNVQLGYTIPVKTSSRASIDRVRLYIQGQNLLTFTKYSGLDPDITIDNITQGFVGGRDYSLGIDRGRYPTARTILFGVNVEF
jgi:TonB-dependent starch-binding outer membrane protein SusC